VSGRSKKKAKEQAFNQTISKMFAKKISVAEARTRLGYEPGRGPERAGKQAAAVVAKPAGLSCSRCGSTTATRRSGSSPRVRWW
jgi:hypothetical protein